MRRGLRTAAGAPVAGVRQASGFGRSFISITLGGAIIATVSAVLGAVSTPVS